MAQKGLIEGFDHIEFANNLSSQAKEVIPKGIGNEDKNFIASVVQKFCLLAGDALNKDSEVTLDAPQAYLIVQFIGEWTFHKSVDLIKSGVDPNLREGILQKVAFTVFEIAKQAVLKRMPQDQIIPLVEHHVSATFKDIINDLSKKGVLDNVISKKALKQSNIDDMAKTQNAAEVPGNNMSDTKILKLASLALLIKNFDKVRINNIVSKFNPPEADVLRQYLNMDNLETKIDSSITKRCLEEMKGLLPEPKVLSVNRFYNKMYKIVKNSPKDSISNIIKKERPLVKEFILSVFKKQEIPIPPRIACVICDYIEEKAV